MTEIIVLTPSDIRKVIKGLHKISKPSGSSLEVSVDTVAGNRIIFRPASKVSRIVQFADETQVKESEGIDLL